MLHQGEHRMKVTRGLAAATAAAAIAGGVGVAVAHHASGPFYDSTRKVEIQGSVTRFVFRNPHAFLHVEAVDDKGEKGEWQIELGAPVSLTRTGWTPDTIPIGLVIKAAGQPARVAGAKGMCCARITRADGSPIMAGGRVTEEQQPPR
jgi:hypothetical protein